MIALCCNAHIDISVFETRKYSS